MLKLKEAGKLRHILGVVFLICFCFVVSTGYARTYYVKPTGNDNNSGTSEAAAWQHIAWASSTLVAGDTVLIRSGFYNESSPSSQGDCDYCSGCGPLTPKNSGTAGHYIVYKGYPGERPVIQGNLNGDYSRYAVNIFGKSYIILDSLIVTRSYRGIYIDHSDHIQIKNCKVYDTMGPTDDNNGGVMLGYDIDPAHFTANCVVKACSLFNNNDNINGSPQPSWNTGGVYSYLSKDCVIEDNVIWDQPDNSFGIRLKNTCVGDTVRRNTIYGCSNGIGICFKNQDIACYENILYSCTDGIIVVLHDSRADTVKNVSVYNNVIYKMDNAGIKIYPPFAVSSFVQNFRSWNNLVVDCPASEGDFPQEEWTTEGDDHPGLWSDYNCFYDSASTRVVLWNGSNYYTLAQYKSATGLDQHSFQSNPLFVNPPYDFHLLPGSPCRGTGQGGVDMGAYPSSSGPDTVPPVITNVQSSGISGNSATIGWVTNEPATSQVNYGLTTSYGSSTTLDVNLVTSHSQGLSGLSPSTLYHFRVRSKDATGNERISPDYTFTTLATDTTPPVITNVQSSGISGNSATIGWVTNEAATSQVNYGLTTSYGYSTTLDVNLVTSHSQGLSGLSPSTLYHFRVRSKDATGNERISPDYTFTTTADSSAELARGIIPTVDGTYPGYSVTSTTDGIIDPDGGTATTWASTESSTQPHWVVIDFGGDQKIRNVTLAWAWNTYQSRWMTPREYHIQRWDGSTYQDVITVSNPTIDSLTTTSFAEVTTSRIRIYQPANMGPIYYPTVIWLTELEIYGQADRTAPVISNIHTSGVTRRQATILWNTNEIATTQVEYGLTTRYGSTTILDTNKVINHSKILTGLAMNTLYHYRVRSKDRAGNEAVSTDNMFRTAKKLQSPIPFQPPDNATVGDPNLSLYIFNGRDSLGYPVLHLFQLDTSTYFNTPRLLESSSFALGYYNDTTTYWSVPQELPMGTYFWRAWAYTDTYPSDTSDASVVFTFRVNFTDILDTAYNLAPENPQPYDTLLSLRPVLQVRLVAGSTAGALSCQFEVSEDPNFSHEVQSSPRIPLGSERTVSWEVEPDLKPGCQFYWRARLFLNNKLADMTTARTMFTGIVHIFPNPFKPSLGHTFITFRNIPLSSSIQVTTISGELVKIFENIQQTDVTWDLKSDDQKDLSSGVYLYWVVTGKKAISGKIYVIR